MRVSLLPIAVVAAVVAMDGEGVNDSRVGAATVGPDVAVGFGASLCVRVDGTPVV